MFNPGPKFHLLFGADGGDDVRLKLWPQAHLLSSEFRSCVRVEVAVLGSPSSVMSLRVGFYGRKAKLNHAHALVTVCPQYVNRHPRALSSTSSSSSSSASSSSFTLVVMTRSLPLLGRCVCVLTNRCSVGTTDGGDEVILNVLGGQMTY